MAEESPSLSMVWRQAEHTKEGLTRASALQPDYQSLVDRALQLYQQCRQLADRLSLFSQNEEIEEVASGDLRYLQIDHRLGEITEKVHGGDRKTTLLETRRHYQSFLETLDSYQLLGKDEVALLGDLRTDPNAFSTASNADPAARRQTKIARFTAEKQLKQKLKMLEQDPRVSQDDDETVRALHITNLHYLAHQTFQSLESLALELDILSKAPRPSRQSQDAGNGDARSRDSESTNGFTERLDLRPNGRRVGAGNGPILSPEGKPLQPFTIIGKRDQLSQGVFRPGHNLPTMTVDEYLEEERRRGGMIEGGGPASGRQAVKNEDDYELADQDTMKAREWDDFTESNPRGAGNTINRG